MIKFKEVGCGRKMAVKLLAGTLLPAIMIISVFLSAISSGAFDILDYYYAVAGQESKLIIIDAGHGGEDIGATGTSGIYEKDINLVISMILGDYLKKAGHTVIFTRTDDRLLYTEEQNIKGFRKIYDLRNRVAVAEEYPSALFISIHMNSFSEPKYSGLQVYYSENNNDSRSLANSIQKEVKQRLQPDNQRACKIGKDIYVMEHIQNVAVLIECGFITNPEECEKLSEKEYQKELSFAILCGIIEYINEI